MILEDYEQEIKKEDIKSYISNGLNINQKDNLGNSLLTIVLIYKKPLYDLELINLLINKDTDINEKSYQGDTFLILAIKSQYPKEIINLFINEETDLNQINEDNESPILLAVQYNYAENILDLLKNKNTNINQKNKKGDSLLLNALRNNYSEKLIKLFINKNTDINQKNSSNESPILLALNYRFKLSNNFLKSLINKKTNINQRDKFNEGIFDILVEKKSRKEVLEIFILIGETLDITIAEDIFNIVKLYVDEFNFNYFSRKFPRMLEKDVYRWSFLEYLLWNGEFLIF